MRKLEYEPTQGSIKLRQYVDDLLRNKHFLSTIKELKAEYGKKSDRNLAYNELKKILDKYKKIDAESKKWIINHDRKLSKLSKKVAEEYGLDMELLRPVMLSLSNLEEGDFKESLLYDLFNTDFCIAVDNNDSYFFSSMPKVLDTRRENHIKAFPVSIDLHRFTTKRDLLDFVEKRWPWIESMLGPYRKNKNIKFRKRKIDRKIVDFVWNNKEMPPLILKEAVDKAFPRNGLVYFEFYKIIYQERNRRNKKIIVGR